MPVMASGSFAWSITVSFKGKLAGSPVMLPYRLFRCRLGGEQAAAKGWSVLTFLQIAGSADEIGKGILIRIAVHPGRLAAFLHLLDRLQERLAHLDDDDVGRPQMLPGAVLDRALRLDREGVLRGKMQSHAAVAVAAL